MNIFLAFVKDESGATAIEYALIGALLSVAAIVAMTSVGHNLSNTYSGVASNVSSAASR